MYMELRYKSKGYGKVHPFFDWPLYCIITLILLPNICITTKINFIKNKFNIQILQRSCLSLNSEKYYYKTHFPSRSKHNTWKHWIFSFIIPPIQEARKFKLYIKLTHTDAFVQLTGFTFHKWKTYIIQVTHTHL